MQTKQVMLLASVALSSLVACTNGTGTVSSAAMAEIDPSQLISIAEAIEIARGEVSGVAVAAVLEIEDDDENEPPAYEVVIFEEGTKAMKAVEVHAETGAVLEIETADEAEGEDESTESLRPSHSTSR
jgi:uncharacterized membrane protein YkoI